MTVAFIDDNRAELGVEPICRVLQVAPSTYYAAKSRPPSRRSLRDEVMLAVLVALFGANYSVYGAHKLWKAARRAGHDIGRDQVARLMKKAGLQGVRRGRRVVTTRAGKAVTRAPDLVKRNFSAERPNALWVTDLKCRRRHLISYADHGTMPMCSRSCRSSGGLGCGRSA